MKNPNAVALGKLGGKASAKKLTPAQRKSRSRKANAAKSLSIEKKSPKVI